MNYGLSLPNFGPFCDAQFTSQLAYEAEQSGWDGFFSWDHMAWPTSNPPAADPWVLLTAIAMRTSRMKIGTLVTPVSRRRPWKLARETVTLDHLSQGRMVLGVGLGSGAKEEYGDLGEITDPHTRAEMLDEGLDILTGLWSGMSFSYKGKHYSIEETCFLPPALQQPRIPIWVAGFWPNRPPIRRAAHWDGFFPLMKDERTPTPNEILAIRELLDQEVPHRQNFDILVSGWTRGNTSLQNADLLLPLQQAGVTWFIEHCDPWHYTLEDTVQRIRLGPPI